MEDKLLKYRNSCHKVMINKNGSDSQNKFAWMRTWLTFLALCHDMNSKFKGQHQENEVLSFVLRRENKVHYFLSSLFI
jgi:hypothetical protein